MRSPVAHLLADLADALRRLDVPWYLFGARAAILHGVARLTADVDVTVRLPATTSAEMLATGLEAHGFVQRVTAPDFMARTRVVPFVHTATSLPLDVVLAGPGLEELFLSRAVQVEVEGMQVPVASAEDIVVMKVLAGRPKDVDDVIAIVAAQERTLDFGYVRGTLDTLERAIGQSDLLPAFEAAMARARRG